MKTGTNLLIFLITLSLACLESKAQELEAKTSTSKPVTQLQLQTVSADDFGVDTREEYEIEGDIAWRKGQLTIKSKASIEQVIHGDAWSRMELTTVSPQQDKDKSLTGWRVWILLEGTSDCFVQVRSGSENRDESLAEVALVDTKQQGGMLLGKKIRQVTLPKSSFGQFTVDYRNGLVTVRAAGALVLMGYIEKGHWPVKGWRIEADTESLSLSSLSFHSTSRLDDPTEPQQRALAEAEASENECVELYNQGKYADAARLAAHILEVRKSVHGELHPNYAASLNNLAVLNVVMGDYNRAESYVTRALEIKESLLGDQHPSYAESLHTLAGLCDRQGEYACAQRLHEEALEIRRQVFGNEHPEYAASLHSVATLYGDLGDYARAERLLTEALEIRKTVFGEQHASYVTSLNNLASLYRKTADYSRAERFSMETVELARTVFGKQHPSYAACLNTLAGLYGDVADYARAEPLRKEVVEVVKSTVGERHPYYATSLNNLALLYLEMGDYARAEQLLEQALSTEKMLFGDEHPSCASSLSNLALLCVFTGDYSRAEEYYLEALKIEELALGKQHPSYAESLNNLGQMYFEMGDYVRAKQMFDQSSALMRTSLGEQHLSYGHALQNLASTYLELGEDVRAERLFRQAMAITRNSLGEQHPTYAEFLTNIAALHLIKEDYASAQKFCQQALDIQRQQLELNSLVQSARQQGRNQETLRDVLDDRISIGLLQASDARGSIEDLWQWKGTVTARQQAYRRIAANQELAPLFAELQSVSRQLSALSGNKPIPPSRSASEVEKRSFEQKRAFWEELFAKLSTEQEDLEQSIASSSEEFRRVREPLAAETVQLWLPSGTALVEVLEYTHVAPDVEQEAKLTRERRLIAYVVRPDREPAMIGLGSAKDIAAQVEDFRRPFQLDQRTPKSLTAAAEAGIALREELWLPLEKHLDDIDTVVISPDTVLGTLPFAALPGKREGSYLIEDYRLAMLPMAQQLWEIFGDDESLLSDKRGLLVVGDVDYDWPLDEQPSDVQTPALLADSSWRREAGQLRSEDDLEYASLPGFEQELNTVHDLFADQFTDQPILSLRGQDATEAAFLEQAAQARTVHVITHGYFADPGRKSIRQADTRPKDTLLTDSLGPDPFINTYLPGLLSGLAMAGANSPSINPDDPRDGILRASEIEACSLQGVELVVLSACETGLGAVAGGEGMTGLQRAFHIAGADSVVASLWRVDDQATTVLMTEFYRNLWEKKMSKIDALREAQLTMLRSYDAKSGQVRGLGGKSVEVEASATDSTAGGQPRLDPRYWAAFQLSGDWR